MSFVQVGHTSIDTANAGRRGFVVKNGSFFVGSTDQVLQFEINGSPDTSNELEINEKLEIQDIASGDAEELFVLSTYSSKVRAKRGFAPSVYPLFVSLFLIESNEEATELFCQPLPVHPGLPGGFAYANDAFVVAYGAEQGSLVILYRRIDNGIKAAFVEVRRAILPQLPNVVSAQLNADGLVLLYNDSGFVVWAITNFADAVDPAGVPCIAVPNLSSATLTPDGRVITAGSDGVIQVFGPDGVLSTFQTALDQSTSFHSGARRANLADDGPVQPGDESISIEAAVAAADAAASDSGSDECDDDDDTVFANAYGDDDSTEGSEISDDAETDMSADLASVTVSETCAATASADAVTDAPADTSVFNDVVNVAFENGKLYVHMYSDDVLIYGPPEPTVAVTSENQDASV